jgi:two-component system, OmpR family, alkaline phosphatase synthesis response regulator PhoP
MKKRLLLVEDEPGLIVMLGDRFRSAGYDLAVATTGPEGLERALGEPFDLVVLDLMLPGTSGLEVCRELRAAGVETPILMLTALGDVIDRVVGLRIGADDYLTKPFATAELLARIEALLRRTRAAGHGAVPLPDPYRFGDVEVRFREAQVLRDGSPVHLTYQMFELLRVFVERRGEALSRDEILDAAWGPDAAPAERTVDVHVAWLRQRLEENPKVPRYLQTVRGLGYRFAG